MEDPLPYLLYLLDAPMFLGLCLISLMSTVTTSTLFTLTYTPAPNLTFSCDYTGPSCIIQDSLLIWRPLLTYICKVFCHI